MIHTSVNLEKGGVMKKGEWTFLSNHGRVFVYLAKFPRSTAQEIAGQANLSIRAVQNIIDDLAVVGYIARHKEGRRNRYTIHPELPMRHKLEKGHSVGEILEVLGYQPNPDE
jgi:DNA-binding IclR family transcriptional regulator